MARAIAIADELSFGLERGRASSKQLIDAARQIEDAARVVDHRMRKFQESSVQQIVNEISICSSNGVNRQFESMRTFGSIECAALENGESQVGWADGWSVEAGALKTEAIGREAAERAISKLRPSRWKTATTNVILAPRVTGSLMSALSDAFLGDQVVRGKSFLANLLGETVAASAVTLIDDGRLPAAAQSAPFDDEGVSTRRNLLIETGMLRSYLHNTKSARGSGVKSTGNAVRSGVQAPPRCGPTSFYLEPGQSTFDQMLADCHSGVLIHEVMGLHTVDPISGDFSLAASGRRIRSGVVSEAVDGIAISGNLLLLLQRVVSVGGDIEMLTSGPASPLRVDEISIAGD